MGDRASISMCVESLSGMASLATGWVLSRTVLLCYSFCPGKSTRACLSLVRYVTARALEEFCIGHHGQPCEIRHLCLSHPPYKLGSRRSCLNARENRGRCTLKAFCLEPCETLNLFLNGTRTNTGFSQPNADQSAGSKNQVE